MINNIKKMLGGKQGKGINLNKAAKQSKYISETIEKAKKKPENKVKKYRQEASRLASMANKRLKRLEEGGYKDSPAYSKWLSEGGVKFGVRGKSHNELQKEVSRMKKFIDSETSTIRGINRTLKDMAKNTGIKYKNLKELQKKASKFFELASKVEQYLRTVDDMASAIGYQKIWNAINKYTKEELINLSSSETDVDSLVKRVTDALKEYEKPQQLNTLKGHEGWFTLPKD